MLHDILTKPGYLHLLLNHLPIIGLALGALALGVALVLRSRPAQITALVVVFTAAASAWPVLASGQQAYKPIRGLVDDAGSDWLDLHMERAEKTIYAFYLLAAVALTGLVAPRRWPRTAGPLAVASLALTLLCLGVGGYIAEAGGRIRHPEFRSSEPPAPSISEPHHHEP